MTRLRTNPLLWIIPPSIAMAVGTTTTLMTILEYNLTLAISDTNITLSIGGIAIGIIGLVIGYYFQNKPSKTMHRLYAKFNKKDGRKKHHYLTRISSNTLLITKNLVRLENLIDKYINDPPPKDWQIVIYSADRSRKKIGEVRKKIVLEFTQIIDLVENSRLS